MGIWSVVLLAVIVAFVIALGASALGTLSSRAAADGTLRRVALLLDARYVDRREIPWYRRPHRSGAVDGVFGEFGYVVRVMPANAADVDGLAVVRIRSRWDRRLSDGGTETVAYTSKELWHWPDRADPEVLASFVRESVYGVAHGVRTGNDSPAGGDQG